MDMRKIFFDNQDINQCLNKIFSCIKCFVQQFLTLTFVYNSYYHINKTSKILEGGI